MVVGRPHLANLDSLVGTIDLDEPESFPCEIVPMVPCPGVVLSFLSPCTPVIIDRPDLASPPSELLHIEDSPPTRLFRPTRHLSYDRTRFTSLEVVVRIVLTPPLPLDRPYITRTTPSITTKATRSITSIPSPPVLRYRDGVRLRTRRKVFLPGTNTTPQLIPPPLLGTQEVQLPFVSLPTRPCMSLTRRTVVTPPLLLPTVVAHVIHVARSIRELIIITAPLGQHISILGTTAPELLSPTLRLLVLATIFR